MKRAAFLAAAVVCIAATSWQGSASAQSGPSGYRLSSPPRAAGGSPIWVRSITPCPPASEPHMHRYVEAWIDRQNGSLQPDIWEVTGDVREDGHWEVTISAPNDFGAGATAHYYVRAVCAEDDPWGRPWTDDGDEEALPRATVVYEPNSLHVTSSGGTADGATGDSGGGSEGSTTTTSTTTSTSTSSTTATTAATTSTTASGGGAQVESAEARAERIAKIRAELEAQGVDTATMSDGEVLATAPVATSRMPVDEGLPWWAFVLATLLAVGAVIGFGVRRSG